MNDPLSCLLRALTEAGLPWAPEDVADAVWLTLRRLEAAETPVPSTSAEEVTPPITPPPPTQPAGLPPVVVSLPPQAPEPRSLETKAVPQRTRATRKGLHLPGSGKASAPMAASVVHVPHAPALPGTLAIARALRPLMRRIPSPVRALFDEATTVRRIAEEGLWLPAVRPAPERWLDLWLVVDEAGGMSVWRQTVDELYRLCCWLGAFRTVRVCGLNTDATPLRLRAGLRQLGPPAPILSPQALIDPAGRSLILVLTDAVSPSWYDGSAAALLETWSQRGPVGLLQVLPERLWPRTGLATAASVRVNAATPAAANSQLVVRAASSWWMYEARTTSPVPVCTLQNLSLAAWARLVAGVGREDAPGLVFRTSSAGEVEEEPDEQLTAAERLQQFRRVASPLAQRLAELLAAAPAVNVPILRLVRRTMLPEAEQVHEAEVLLSGLLYLAGEGQEGAAVDEVRFEFSNGVRPLLRDSLPTTDAMAVLRKVAHYIEEHWGRLGGFSALLADSTARAGSFVPGDEPFARIAAEVLHQIGGDAALLVGAPEVGFSEAATAEPSPAPPAATTKPAAPSPWKRFSLFLSFNQAESGELAERLRRDLEAAGHAVIADPERVQIDGPWGEEAIRRSLARSSGLNQCGAVIALLGPRSTGQVAISPRATSACLEEWYYAMYVAKAPILPVLAAACRVPFSVQGWQCIDLTDPSQYAAGLRRLLSAIAAVRAGDLPPRSRWYHEFDPLDFGDYLAERRREFFGRRWVMHQIEAWRTSTEERVLLLAGEPGVGKTALVAQLVHLNPGGQVLAYHCCQADNPESTNPARFIRSLAFQLANRFEFYEMHLAHGDLIEALSEEHCLSGPAAAFEAAFGISAEWFGPPPETGCYLLIDSLDNAVIGRPGDANLVSLLAEKLPRMPPWVRLVATTRPDHEVLHRLGKARVRSMTADNYANRTDLAGYVAARLGSPALAKRLSARRRTVARVHQQLTTKAAGNFLYAQQVLHAIERDLIDLDDLDKLPPGLAGIYETSFARLYPDSASYEPARRILEVVLAAFEPLPLAQLVRATGLEPDVELPGELRYLASYVVSDQGRYGLFHGSLGDWLMDPDNRFHARCQQGHLALANAGWEEHRAGPGGMSAYMLRYLPVHLENAGDRSRGQRVLDDVEYLLASGDLLLQIGETVAGQQRYERGIIVSRRHAVEDSWSTQSRRHLSICLDRLGTLREAKGDLDGAERAYRDDLDNARRLAEISPNDTQAERDVAVSCHRLGDIRLVREDLTGAASAYREEREVRRRLSNAFPHKTQWRQNLLATCERLGDVRVALGELFGAERAYHEAWQLLRGLAEAGQDNSEMQRALSMSGERLGDVRRTLGDLAGAENAYAEALEAARRLAEANPYDTEAQRDLSIRSERLADVRLALGNQGGAEQAYHDSLDIARRLANAEPGNADAQRDLAVAFHTVALYYDRCARAEQADICLWQCWEVLRRMRESHMHLDASIATLLRELDRRFCRG